MLSYGNCFLLGEVSATNAAVSCFTASTNIPPPPGEIVKFAPPHFNPPGQPGGRPLGEAADKCITHSGLFILVGTFGIFHCL